MEIYPVDSALHLLNNWCLGAFVDSDIELFSKIMQNGEMGDEFWPTFFCNSLTLSILRSKFEFSFVAPILFLQK